MTGVAGAPRSFFHLAGVDLIDQACQGTACFVARHRAPDRWASAEASEPRVYCLGMCHAAPATAVDDVRPHIDVDAAEPVVLGRVAAGGAPTFSAARATGAYRALEHALSMAPAAIIDEVERSRLRGRGGAAFPAGRKWRSVRAAADDDAIVVANADEGDPGAYIDRVLIEDDPHALIEGLAIAGVAVGATGGYVYVRREYPRARARLQQALAEARQVGVLGRRLLGTGPAFDVEVVEGEGSYVCGEETALLNAIEGRRPEVRSRPPYPAQRGLFGRPTLVNNVETLAAIPWIVSRGGAAYAAMGTPGSAGTKALSLNSLFRRPGLYEVELGLPVREVVERLGGGLTDGALRGVLIGGPLAGVLPPRLLDTPLGFEELRAVGCEVGHGGVVAVDEHTSIPELVHHVFRFGAYESCGKCTPCRLGTGRIEDVLRSAIAGARPPESARDWREIVAALAATSLCGHGTGLAAFASSIVTYFGEEIERCLG
jgi:NADH:ubiquinone oxidoreductase subunit F (NADH-binding)